VSGKTAGIFKTSPSSKAQQDSPSPLKRIPYGKSDFESLKSKSEGPFMTLVGLSRHNLEPFDLG